MKFTHQDYGITINLPQEQAKVFLLWIKQRQAREMSRLLKSLKRSK